MQRSENHSQQHSLANECVRCISCHGMRHSMSPSILESMQMVHCKAFHEPKHSADHFQGVKRG